MLHSEQKLEANNVYPANSAYVLGYCITLKADGQEVLCSLCLITTPIQFQIIFRNIADSERSSHTPGHSHQTLGNG